MGVVDEDLIALQPVLATGLYGTPNVKLSIYKNRRGRYKGIYLWCIADLGTCRIIPQFATTYSYEMIDIEDTKISVEDMPSAF